MKKLLENSYFKIYLVLLPIVCGISYFITHRAFLRLAQLKANTIDVQVDNTRAMIYSIIMALVFSLIYYFIVKDLKPQEEEF
ncbi:MAG: hypothetical protein NWS86_07720 [Flavobacteriales bacterium]|nr:hypothetical protein [Flavobacteriales bacterium]